MQTCATPPVSSSRARRRWLVGFAALLVGAPVAYLAYDGYTARRELAAFRAQLDATDPGWRLADIEAARPRVPDAENSALVVLRLARAISASQFSGLISASGYPDWTELTPQMQFKRAELAMMREAVAPLRGAREEALRLRDMPVGRYAVVMSPDFISTLVPHLQESRTVAAFWEQDAFLRAADGDLAGAVQSCNAILGTARSIGDEPFIISQLVRIAEQAVAVGAVERVLAHGEAPEAELGALQGALERDLAAPLLLYAARGERAGGEVIEDAVAAGILKPSTLRGLSSPGAVRARWWDRLADFLSLPHGADRLAHLRLSTRVVEASKLPVEQMHARLADFKTDLQRQPALVRDVGWGLSKVITAYTRVQARLRTTVVAVAAERYRLRHRQWPVTADDLVADRLLGAVPADPFDGRPLRWRLLDDGAVGYSVGPDGADDRGNLDRGAGPPGTDFGVRLWNVAARRQPPQERREENLP